MQTSYIVFTNTCTRKYFLGWDRRMPRIEYFIWNIECGPRYCATGRRIGVAATRGHETMKC